MVRLVYRIGDAEASMPPMKRAFAAMQADSNRCLLLVVASARTGRHRSVQTDLRRGIPGGFVIDFGGSRSRAHLDGQRVLVLPYGSPHDCQPPIANRWLTRYQRGRASSWNGRYELTVHCR